MHQQAERTALVRFPDCDPFQHLNNARDLDYLLNAREDHLRKRFAFDLYAYSRETGCAWVVGENGIAYVRPARLVETVVLRLTLLVWSDRYTDVERTMWDATGDVLKALLWSRFVHVNVRTGRSEAHGDNLHGRFAHLAAGRPDGYTFDQRLAALRAAGSPDGYDPALSGVNHGSGRTETSCLFFPVFCPKQPRERFRTSVGQPNRRTGRPRRNPRQPQHQPRRRRRF